MQKQQIEQTICGTLKTNVQRVEQAMKTPDLPIIIITITPTIAPIMIIIYMKKNAQHWLIYISK